MEGTVMNNFSFRQQLDLLSQQESAPVIPLPTKATPSVESAGRDPRRAEIFEFPQTRSTHRAASNDLVRSALFSCVPDKDRIKHIENQRITTLDGTIIEYSGEQLNQDDHDIFMQILYFAAGGGKNGSVIDKGDNIEVCFSNYELTLSMGKSTGGKNYAKHDQDIKRLLDAKLVVRNSKDKWETEGKQIEYRRLFKEAKYKKKAKKDQVSINEKNGAWCIEISKDIPKYLGMNGFTFINWEKRKLMRGNLVRWLHLNFASHAEPFPVKVDTLRKLSGHNSSLNKFREKLKAAFAQLVDLKIISKVEWDTESDLVKVFRYNTMSPSQAAFMARRKQG